MVGSHDIELAECLKESVRLCRKFYLRYGSKLTLEQLNELEVAIKQKCAHRGWPVYGPECYDEDGFHRDDQKLDSSYFEQMKTRSLFSELLKPTTAPRANHPTVRVHMDRPEFHHALLKLIGFPVPVPSKDLENCYPNWWKTPAGYAHALLAFYFNKDVTTVAKSLSQIRTARKRSPVQTADIRTFDPRTIDLRPLIFG